MRYTSCPSFAHFTRRLGVMCAALGCALPAFATAYIWSTSVVEGDWTAPTSWTAGSGYPASSSDSAKFTSASATVNIDVAKTVGSVADTFQSSDVKFVGGKTLTISGGSWKILKASKIEASGSGTKVLFSGSGCKYVYGSNNRLRASDGGCIEVRGFKPGTAMWDLSTNLPSNMKVEAEGEGSLIDLRMDNNSEGIVGSGFTFLAKDGGEIQYGLGRSKTQYCKNAIFKSKDAAVVLDDGSFVMGYTGFSMSTDYAGQSIEIKGAEPLLSAATYVTIAGGGAAVSVRFVPEPGWAEFATARIQSGTTATLGVGAAISIDGSAFGAVAGTKLIRLISGATELAVAEGVISGATISGFASGVTASLVTNQDDDTLAANTLYLKLVSNVRAVGVPVITGATYDGQPHTAVVPASDDYTVTTLPTDVVDAGDYDVVLTLTDPATTAWDDDGTSTPKTLKFTIAKAVNSWTTEPSLSKTTWAMDAEPATVNSGVPASGTEVVVTYDDDEIQMPTNVGSHTAYFNVAESKNHFALVAEVDYEVTKRVNAWTTQPVVSSFNIEDPAPVFTPPTSKFGEVVTYYDGDTSKTEMPTDLGQHSVTYKVLEGDDYAAFEQTIAYAVTYKPIVDRNDPSKVYGYRIPRLGDAQNEVALIFTNTAYTAADPMKYRLPQYVTEVSYLVVGGGAGGGGGKDGTASGRGGGGAGGVLTGDVWAVSGDLIVVVGKGGAGMSSSASAGLGGDGGMSLVANGEITKQAYGGGGGAAGYAGKGGEGYGCGGGGSTKVISSQYVGQAGGEAGQGFAGGAGGDSTYLGGGGGGAGEAGYASNAEHPGHGGDGIVCSITGDEKWYAGGGGGSKASNVAPKIQSNGGQGGGGRGGYAASNQNGDGADASYFGSGGGGAHKTARGGNGYQGIVVVRYVEDATAVAVPVINAKAYNGELQTADVPSSSYYTVTANEGGTDVGEYPVELTLATGYHWDGGTAEPTNLVFVITQGQNEWTVEPSISKDNWLTTDEPGVITNGVTRFGEVTRVLVKNGALVQEWTGDLPTAAGVYVITNIAPATTANYLAPEVTEKTVSFTIFGASETPDFTVSFNGDVSVGANDGVVTAAVPYRVSCDVESPKLVNIHALVTLDGAAATDVTLAENVALDATGIGLLNDLKPGATYEVALYGLGVEDGKSSPTTEVVQVTTPGPATGLTASATFTNDPKEFVISGSVTPGLGTTTVYLRWSLNSDALDNLATYTFVYGDAGAFAANIAYTALNDTLTWDVAVSNDFASTTYGALSWNDALAATTKTRVDMVATTYTWTGNGGDNLWTNAANWTANKVESYGYPDNSSYATAKFTMAATVDLDGGTFELVESGVVVSSNLGEVRLCNGAIDVPYKDFAYGASGTTIVFDSVTIKGQKGLKFIGNSPTVFSGDTAQEWLYEPWDAKNTKMIVRNGQMSSGFFQTYIDDSARRHVVDITNAVWTVRSKTGQTKYLSSPAIVMTLLDGADRQAQFVSLVEMSLGKTWSIAIPEQGHKLPSIQAPTLHADTDSCQFEVNVTDYKSGRKVPIVKFTGADQSETMAAKLEKTTLVAKTRKKNGDLVDVTAKRNVRLVWSAEDNTLYYKQDAQLGMMVFVR